MIGDLQLLYPNTQLRHIYLLLVRVSYLFHITYLWLGGNNASSWQQCYIIDISPCSPRLVAHWSYTGL